MGVQKYMKVQLIRYNQGIKMVKGHVFVIESKLYHIKLWDLKK